MNRAATIFAIPVLFALVACARPGSDGHGGATDCGGSGGAYVGPEASPVCESEAYASACHTWRTGAVPYCYGPAGQGDVGPAPFPSCVMVLGASLPPVARNESGWASWWCCPYDAQGDGGTVVLDGGPAGM